MELKGKQVEAFVKALDESEKMNKVRENNEVKSYMSFTKEELAELKNKEYNAIYNEPNEVNKSNINDAELEKLKEIIQKQGALKVNPKLVKECTVTTEWAKEDESDNEEEEVPVSVVEVIKKCSCGGEFEYTPGMTQTLEYPPHYTHTCNKCGKVKRFLRTYPYQRFKRNDE